MKGKETMTKTVFTSYTNFKEKYGESLPFISAVCGAYTAPEALSVIYVEGVTAIFLRDNDRGPRSTCTAEAYGWKAKRNSYWYTGYSTPEKRSESVSGFINNLLKHTADVAASRKGAEHDVKVGDIFSASWGYDQTNVDYYKVTRTTKCTADLVKIGKIRIDGSHVSPSPSSESEETFTRKRIKAGYKGEPCIRIDSSRHTSRCAVDSVDYETPWGFGH
jgi:hypothetical protein